MIRSLCIIFGCLAVGQIFISLTHIPFPASIVGLGVLFVLLQSRQIKVEWVGGISDTLMANLSLFLVPPCVAVMDYLGLVGKNFWAFAGATAGSTLLVLWVTALVHQFLRARSGRRTD